MSSPVTEIFLIRALLNGDQAPGEPPLCHVSNPTYFYSILNDFYNKSYDGMVRLLLIKENGQEVTFLKIRDGTVMNHSTGKTMTLAHLHLEIVQG